MDVLQAINTYPLAGAVVIVIMLIAQQLLKLWLGKGDVTRIEQENNKLAKQTSETVNHCAARSHAVMEKLEEFLHESDLRHIPDRLDKTLLVLEKVVEHQGSYKTLLDRVLSLSSAIDADIKRTDSRVVHQEILNYLEREKDVLADIKRIVQQLNNGRAK